MRPSAPDLRQVSLDLVGKVALVTGASAGLGCHFARVLAAHGAVVAVAARRLEACRAVCASIESAGGRAFPVTLDVTSGPSVDAVFREIADEVGGIDILVNNAGVANASALLDTDEAIWDEVIDTNLKGSFLVAKAFTERQRAIGRGGAIVNIASILGLRVAGHVGAYAASKAGLVQLTKAMALEWARFGIRVNALCPGYIETDLNRTFFASDAGQALIKRVPTRRLGQLADLDGPLLLLCSDAGAAMTGAVIAVDGGHMVSSL